MADLLELEGAVAYRVLAYRRAAKTLRETHESVVRLSEQGRLIELPGVGDTISDKVGELIANGRIAALEKLVAATPPGVVPLMRVPGVGPKTAKRVFSELGVETVDEVLQAARDGRIQGLAGMGERTEQAILAGLEARGDAKVTCIAHDGTRVELRMVEPSLFGNLLQHLSGSKDHNVALREAAVKAGLKVSEYGIEELATGEVMRTRDEAEVYQRLG